MPSKSMPHKSDHDFKEKYLYIRAGTIEPMSIKDRLTKNRFFTACERFRIRLRHMTLISILTRKIWFLRLDLLIPIRYESLHELQ